MDSLNKYADASLKISNDNNYKEETAWSYLWLSVYYKYQFQRNDFYESVNKAYNIFHEINSPRGSINALIMFGAYYKSIENYSAAYSKYKQALKLLQSNYDPFLLMQTLSNLAQYYYTQNEFPKADSIHSEVRKLTFKYNDIHRRFINNARHVYVLVKLNKSELAVSYMEENLGMLHGLSNSPLISDTYNDYALILISANRAKEALKYINAALRLDEIKNNPLLVEMMYKNMVDAYRQLGDYKDAYYAKEKEIEFNTRKFKRIEQENIKSQTITNDALNKTKESEKYFVIITAVAGILFILVLSIGILYRQKLKYNRNLELEVKNRTEELLNKKLTLADEIAIRQNAEKEIKLNAEKFQIAFKNAPTGMMIIHSDGHCIAVNSMLCQMFGYTEKEMLEGTIEKIIHPDDIERTDDWINKMIPGDSGQLEFERRYIHKDGHIVCGLVQEHWIRNNDGSPLMSIVHILDITQRKLVEEFLIKNGEILRQIIESSPIAMIVTTNDFVAQYMNKTFADLFGYTIDDIPTIKEWWPLAYPDDKYRNIIMSEWNSRTNEAKMLSKPIVPIEATVRCKDGSDKVIEFNSSLIGEQVLIVSVDITERKTTEEKIKKMNAELTELVSIKDRFFSIIAHDLKGSINGLVGVAQILKEESMNLTDAEFDKFIDSIYEVSKETYRLLENLLHWSRLQTGKMIFSPERIHLYSTVHQVIKLLSEVAEQKSIIIKTEINPNLYIDADENMIELIIRNLLTNAIKFSHTGGEININAQRSNGNIQISVKDNGTGMEKKTLNSLFKLDQQSSGLGTNKERGTGLGLLLCRDMVNLHKGEIFIESEPGKGSKFTFSIPFN